MSLAYSPTALTTPKTPENPSRCSTGRADARSNPENVDIFSVVLNNKLEEYRLLISNANIAIATGTSYKEQGPSYGIP